MLWLPCISKHDLFREKSIDLLAATTVDPEMQKGFGVTRCVDLPTKMRFLRAHVTHKLTF